MERRVMFLIYSLCGGGAQRVLVDAANALCADGKFDITVQALFHDDTCARQLEPGVHYRAAFRLRRGLAQKLLSGFVQYIVPPRLVYWLLFRGKYDVEVAFMEAFPTKILAYSTNRRAKKYAWVHIDMEAYTKQDRLYRSLTHQMWCYRQYDGIYCVSESVRRAFVHKFGMQERTGVVYNILDAAKLREQARHGQYKAEDGRFLFVAVGSLIPRKGFARLIKACAQLKREKLVFRLLILGEGEQREELEKLIRTNALMDEVRLLGYCGEPAFYLAAADLFVCSSYAEGLSTAACEALLLGVPVLATDCAGMRELLGVSEYGLLVENADAALLAGMRTLLQDPALLARYRAKARRGGEALAQQTRLEEYKRILMQ